MTRRPRTSDKAAHNRTAAARRPASRRPVERIELELIPIKPPTLVERVVTALPWVKPVVEKPPVVERRGWLDRLRDWLQSFYGAFGMDIARL